MIKIAICDDDREFLEKLKEMLKNYFINAAVKIWAFPSVKDLMNAAEEEGGFDVYILDVIMPRINGVELGMELRRRGDRGEIIFLTTTPEYAVMSYEAKAFFYLLKPVDKNKLVAVLNQAIGNVQERNKKGLAVKTRDGVKFLPFDEIMYAELRERAVAYNLVGGGRITGQYLRVPFREAVSKLLEDSRFTLCGASFCINLSYVKALENNRIVFKNNSELALSKKAVGSIKTKWLDFWLEENK